MPPILQEKISFISKRISDTDIMSIPGNAFALSGLVECLCNEHHHQRPIAFVGAGASAELYPLWQPLLIELGKAAIEQGVITTNTPQWWIEIAESDPPTAAKMITAELGEAEFRKFICSQFCTKYTAEGRSFTRAQGEIILTSYKGFVTTNYDPGLLEARIRLRENPTATGYCTRLNRDKLTGWLDGSLFYSEDCPVFYAHGIWDDHRSWVLDIDQYDQAYSDHLYIRVLEKLWMQERLVCIGFSFLDPWVRQMASRLTRELMENSPRGIPHFALVGYRDGIENGYAANRRYWAERFGARVIYYPVYRDNNIWSDHSALIKLLNAMRKTCAYACAFADYDF